MLETPSHLLSARRAGRRECTSSVLSAYSDLMEGAYLELALEDRAVFL